MASYYPDRPIASPWQDVGQTLLQGAGVVGQLEKGLDDQAQRGNLLQDMVERRTQQKLEEQRLQQEIALKAEQAARDKEDRDREDQARSDIADLISKGVKVPGSTTETPATVENIPGPWAPSRLPPSAPYDVQQTPGLPSMPVERPGQSVTTEDSYRPATMEDYQKAALPTETPSTFIKNLTPPNRSAAMTAVANFIRSAKAAGNTMIKGSDLDAAALSGDPTSAILSDKQYLNWKKTYATDAQAQTAATGVANADSNKIKADAAAKNAETSAKRAALAAMGSGPNFGLPKEQYDGIVSDLATGALPLKDLRIITGIGSKGSEKRAQLYAAARALNPGFNPAQFEQGFKAFTDNSNQRTIATIDNVSRRMDHLAELSAGLPRTQFKTLNDWINSGRTEGNNLQQELLNLNQDLTGEELNMVFGQGKAGSDAKLKLAQEVSNIKNLPIDVAAAKIKEIKEALATRRSTFLSTMGVYGQSKDSQPIQSSTGKTSVVFH